VGAYNVYDDGYTVGSTARCSCGVGHYDYTTSYFIDRCPNCGGNLYFEQGAYSGPAYTSPEGLWACSRCDMDFCAQCGKSHDNRGYWLTRTNKPAPPKPQPKEDLDKNTKEEKDVHVSVKGPLGRQHTFKIPHNFIKALKEGT
jgi:hypothetical protein